MTSTRPYHVGAVAVQERAGVRHQAERVGRGIRDHIPPIAAEFVARQPFLIVGHVDGGGRVWCSLLVGPSGFVTVPDDGTVVLAARPAPDEPLASLSAGEQVGLLAIEPETRRRMRVNGIVRHLDDGMVVDAEEVFSNCPRYITPRDVTPVVELGRAGATGKAHIADRLSTRQWDAVASADTFFLATIAPNDGGVDASHRGGEPGFVTVVDDRRITWPDFPGNAMFLSLGNIELDARAGVLVVDWDAGTTLQLVGHASLSWPSDDERVVTFDIDEVRETVRR